jgi:lipopolysaccharide biosynthesis glycosyltransferase
MTSEMTDQSVMIFHGINVKDFKNLDSSKNLIYYTVSGDLKYLELLEISIKSLIDLGKYKDDILIICDSNIKENININYPNLKFMLVDKVDGNLSAGNKLRVYEYSHLPKYDNILFLDSDILIINDINLLFKESNLVKDKFIVSSEIGLFHNNRVITNNGHAGELLTEDQKITYKDIPCINSGCFLFRNNKENLEILKETYNLYINGKRFHLYEQPYFNYVLLMKNKFIHNLQSYVSHTSLVDKEKSIIHYCGSVGNFQSKFKFMKRDLELLKIDKNLISYDSNIINIWIDNDSIFINSSLDIFDSKVIIWDDDLFMYKELVNFSKGANFWFKPGKKLEDFKKCQVEVLDKYDNLITKYVKL